MSWTILATVFLSDTGNECASGFTLGIVCYYSIIPEPLRKGNSQHDT